MVAARDTPVTGNLLRRGCWGSSRAREAGSSSLPSHRTWPILRMVFIQSWRGPKPLLLIALALMLVHSPREKLEAM
jgi:hypothetical protein